MKKILSLIILATSLVFPQFSYAEIEVIVHPSNESILDKTSIMRIYLGKTRAFPNGDEAIPITLAEGNETEIEFSVNILGKTPKQLKAYWAKMLFTGRGTPPRQLDTTNEILSLIANNPNLIGFVPEGYADSSVKIAVKF